MENRQVGDLFRRNATEFTGNPLYRPRMAALVGCVVRISLISRHSVYLVVVALPSGGIAPEALEILSQNLCLPKPLARETFFERVPEAVIQHALAQHARRSHLRLLKTQ